VQPGPARPSFPFKASDRVRGIEEEEKGMDLAVRMAAPSEVRTTKEECNEDE
jgi:hypothetical protein